MAWGNSGNVVTTNLDLTTDNPSLARVDIYNAFNELIAVISGRNTANGVCPLDGGSKVPAGNLPDTLQSSTGNNLILSPDTKRVAVQDVLNLPVQTVSALTALTSIDGDIAYCSDGDAGSPCIAIYDGTDWLRISLGAAISTT